MSQTVAAFLLNRLRERGVEHVFGYAGDGINGLLAAWERAENQPKLEHSRHEEMSAFQAVGYAKFTGRMGVCVATSGPGAINLLTAATTRSWATSRWWPSWDRPTAAPWAVTINRRSTCSRCSRTCRRVLPDVHGPRTTSQRARPSYPHRVQPAERDRPAGPIG